MFQPNSLHDKTKDLGVLFSLHTNKVTTCSLGSPVWVVENNSRQMFGGIYPKYNTEAQTDSMIMRQEKDL